MDGETLPRHSHPLQSPLKSFKISAETAKNRFFLWKIRFSAVKIARPRRTRRLVRLKRERASALSRSDCEKPITEQPVQSNPATCAADLVFLKRKRRKTIPTVRIAPGKPRGFQQSAVFSFRNENRRFSLQVSKIFFDTQSAKGLQPFRAFPGFFDGQRRPYRAAFSALSASAMGRAQAYCSMNTPW